MAEKLRLVDIEKLSSRYWDGHSSADNCNWTQKPAYLMEPFYDDSLREFAERAIVDYRFEENQQPISTLKKGDTFDGTRLSQGTILKYDREELKINLKGTTWGTPFLSFSLWGVVCDRTHDDGNIEKVIIPFIDFPDGGFLPSPTENPTLTVGTTRHKRIEGHLAHVSESLIKITSLSVHKIP